MTDQNLEIPLKDRCPNCKGQGSFHGGVCSIPWHPAEKDRPCNVCDGTGLNEASRNALKKAEQAAARKQKRVQQKGAA